MGVVQQGPIDRIVGIHWPVSAQGKTAYFELDRQNPTVNGWSLVTREQLIDWIAEGQIATAATGLPIMAANGRLIPDGAARNTDGTINYDATVIAPASINNIGQYPTLSGLLVAAKPPRDITTKVNGVAWNANFSTVAAFEEFFLKDGESGLGRIWVGVTFDWLHDIGSAGYLENL